jgi:5-carboxymethyl-2-hydroxymuconate isomerase
MLNLCCIVVAILKMATSRNFSMSGINSGHHNLPTYEMALKSDNVEFVAAILKMATGEEQFCILKIFEMSAIFKMAAKIQKFNIV